MLAAWYDALRHSEAYRNEGYAYEVDGAVGETAFVERGGFWNDRDGRAAAGITKADVNGCRRDLRVMAGVRLSFDAVDSLLTEAAMTEGASLQKNYRAPR